MSDTARLRRILNRVRTDPATAARREEQRWISRPQARPAPTLSSRQRCGAYTADELKAAVLAKLDLRGRQEQRRGQPARLVSRRRLRDPRHRRRRWIASTTAAYQRRPQARLLSLARVPDRPPAVRRDDQSRHRRADDRRRCRSSASISTALRTRRVRRGARQRRPRPARRLLHGQHGDAVDRRPRLRHPLRQRPVPPDHPQRLAAGDARGLAGPRQPLGIRAAGGQLCDRLRRLGRGGRRGRRRQDAPRLASRRDGRGGRLRHADRRLARAPRQHAAAVVGARRPIR